MRLYVGLVTTVVMLSPYTSQKHERSLQKRAAMVAEGEADDDKPDEDAGSIGHSDDDKRRRHKQQRHDRKRKRKHEVSSTELWLDFMSKPMLVATSALTYFGNTL